MKCRNFIFILLIPIISSCTSLLYTSLDVLRPAKIAFAKGADKLLIVNNTVTQPADFGHTNYLYEKQPYKLAFDTDSLSLFCLGALAQDIESKDFFAFVKLSPKTVNTGTDFEKINQLSAFQVYKLCADSNANAILSLDKIKMIDDLQEQFYQESNSYVAGLELRFETSWSIYYPFNAKHQTIQFKDTVYWESESYVKQKAIAGLPKREDAFVDGALNVGHKSVDRFIPYWDKADRYFFNPSEKFMKQGIDSVYVRNWSSAVKSWELAYNSTKSDYIKAQAANNLAVGYEILGNMDKAIEYATNAYYLFSKLSFSDYDTIRRMAGYISDLSQRKSEIAVIKQQLGE